MSFMRVVLLCLVYAGVGLLQSVEEDSVVKYMGNKLGERAAANPWAAVNDYGRTTTTTTSTTTAPPPPPQYSPQNSERYWYPSPYPTTTTTEAPYYPTHQHYSELEDYVSPNEGNYQHPLPPYPYLEDPFHPDPYPPYDPYNCPQVCDLDAWPRCQCISDISKMFTEDGRGNCNVGATQQDLQVWCFVDPEKSFCPDTRRSDVVYGRYYSRFACITE